MKYEVVVYVDSNGTHLHQIYSGLFLLHTYGEIDLKLRTGRSTTKTRGNRQFLALDVRSFLDNKYKRCIFDMQDSPKISLLESFNEIDFYFKRSFQKDFIAELPLKYRERVLPFGLNYQALLCNGNRVLERVLLEFISRPFNPFYKKNRFHAENIFDLLKYEYFKKRNNYVPFPNIEAEPDRAAEPSILFQCRLWPEKYIASENKQDFKNVNKERVDLISALKKEFGNKFIGGLQPTKEAVELYPDLITSLPSRRKSYIEVMKKSLVVINSPGLLNSMGWKFAEYIAAGKCIVSSKISAELPGDFSSGHHYLEYESIHECIDACSRLLNQPEFASIMSKKNIEYYDRYLRPDSIIGNCLVRTQSSSPA
ncbi:glycosyltransferase [Marinobacter vulgaris]|uniref:glycosyltransferase n=1 Tax=Marinobacter vulgaris TaxID=1928331 RepID=UPI0011834C8E|nr:glycosyltransferase [Marinobacter vulgaris]TSJ70301.1 glycosyltransferase family 1 protein [Marinobacter vulgaris]